ncbi:MAG: glycosyltransferase family 4 protein, partial [Elusimicrobia bacterium]|nr:glycosyltransferase family 4 protein [Elusimicrobiota bacterium]
RALERARFSALLVCGEGGYFDEQVRRDPSVRAIFIPALTREIAPGRDLLALFQLANVFLAEKPDIVHTHSSKAGILGRLAAALAGVPVVVHTYHGFGFHDRQNALIKAVYVALERLCAPLTTKLIFVSRANAEYAEKHRLGRAADAALIRSGVRLDDFPASVDKDALKMSAGIGRHATLVVSIGNLKPQKNAGDFVAAAARAAKAAPHARFVFIGDGPQRRALEAKAFTLGLNDRLFFLGWRRDAARWLAAADVFALTSLWEGLPRALVEAMRTGLPSVCYATDGVVDVLHDGVTGLLAPPGDVEAFAQKLTNLLLDAGLRARLGAAARASIGPEFDIDEMVRAQERLYLELLEGPRD